MKCHSTKCDDLATHRVYWPSGPIEVCLHCAARWGRVADAMGLSLHVEDLNVARLARTLLADDQPK